MLKKAFRLFLMTTVITFKEGDILRSYHAHFSQFYLTDLTIYDSKDL
jgi:hypothetical protein